MAESLVNSIARLRVIEKRLLTNDQAARLVAAQSYEDALRLLREAGYGQRLAPQEGAEQASDELEQLISAELANTYAAVDELMPQRFKYITDLFRMRHDIINIKLLYKLRLLDQPLENAALDPGGVFDEAKLKKAMASGDYSFMPRDIGERLEKLDVDTYRGADPKAVSVAIDNAYVAHCLSSGNSFVRKYFRAFADFGNILIILRGGAGDWLPEGDILQAELVKMSEAFKKDPAKLADMTADALTQSELRRAVRGAYEACLKSGGAAAFEGARDEYLIKLAAESKTDIDSPGPIVGYMLAREREAAVVRLILTAKRSGIPMSFVKERGVGLYG